MSALFIGMPVFNGEKFIHQAIDSLMQQTFTDWYLLISDNASTDGTFEICKGVCARDSRISYIKQPENLGALKNFKFLLEQAGTEYFMWASADDMWEYDFLKACIMGLETMPEAGLAFTNMVNVDSFGQVIRKYPSFRVFAQPDHILSIVNYVLLPEIFGKANLYYSVYRLSSLKSLMLDLFTGPLFSSGYMGEDVAFNLALLCRTRIHLDERVLFKKRYVRPSDTKGIVNELTVENAYVDGMLSLLALPQYETALFEACRNTEYEALVENLIIYRRNVQLDIQSKNDQIIMRLQEERQQLYEEMALRVEEATWKFARWTWLKKILKYINSVRKNHGPENWTP